MLYSSLNIVVPIIILLMFKSYLITFLIVTLAISFEINSPTFITLDKGIYEFKTNGGKAPYKYEVSGLPKGISLQKGKLISGEQVEGGQYILSVKCSDALGRNDEKIIILNVESSSGNQKSTNTVSRSQTSTVSSIQPQQATPSINEVRVTKSSNPTVSSIQNNQFNNNGNSRATVTTQRSSSSSSNNQQSNRGSVNLSGLGNVGTIGIISTTPAQQNSNLDINNLKSLFGDDSTSNTGSTVTTTTSTTSFNTALNAGKNEFDFNSVGENKVNKNDFGGAALDLNGKSSITNLNTYFNDINVKNTNQINAATPRTTSTSDLTDILNNFSAQDTVTNQIKIDATNIDNKISTTSYKFDLKDNEVVDDQEANRLFQAQKVAANYVATNFSAVQQITANKKTIYDLMTSLSTNYEGLTQTYRVTINDLNVAAANKSKIQSAIGNLNTHLNSITSQIDASNNKRLSLSSQRITLLNQNNQSDLEALQITQNIELLNQQLLIVNNSFSNNADYCSKIGNNLLQTDKNISVSNSQLGLINHQLSTNNKDVLAKQAVVDDLVRRLAIAQKELVDAQNTGANLNKQRLDIQQKISTLSQNIVTLRANQNECNSQLSSIKQNITVINAHIQANTTALRNHGGNKDDRNNQIAILDNQIHQESSRRDKLIIQKQNAGTSLLLLQNALPSASNKLNSLISKKSQLEFNMQSQERNLKETIAKYREYERKLQIVTMDLQNARAISQQADQSVNSMLARKKNILPYAIGVQSAALIGQTIVNSKININNWFNFLSANFGGNLIQYENEDVDSLYTFNLLPSSLQNNIQCPLDQGKLKCISGKISSIKNSNEIVITSDGSGASIQLQFPACATLHANIANYNLKEGDSIIIKAQSKNQGVATVKKLVCLRH